LNLSAYLNRIKGPMRLSDSVRLGSGPITTADACLEAYSSEQVLRQPVVSSGDAPEVLEATGHAFDGVAVGNPRALRGFG
jgi:hypothetical protein